MFWAKQRKSSLPKLETYDAVKGIVKWMSLLIHVLLRCCNIKKRSGVHGVALVSGPDAEEGVRARGQKRHPTSKMDAQLSVGSS